MPVNRPLIKGIYTPLPTFFDDNEELDVEAFKKHVVFTASAGTIPVIAGSMGEAPHLSHEERTILIHAARTALDSHDLSSIPVVVGAGTSSTRESIIIAQKCASAGADCVMVIPPGYYAGPLKSDILAVRNFFVDIANASPIPVMMYNFPGVSSGIDLDSDLIIDVVKSAPNICGIKLTCASVGKLTRITAVTDDPVFQAQYPRKDPRTPFMVIDGYIDILLPSMASGAAGAISGLPNFAPKTCVKLWELCLEAETDGEKKKEAKKLQALISQADGYAAKIGIPGMKKLLNRKFGYGSNPRRPLRPFSDDQGNAIFENEYILKIMDMEETL